MKKLLLILFLTFSGLSVFSQIKITSQEASKHIGDTVFVFDKVYGGKLLNNGMTLLNVGGDFPNHLLVVMIKPKDRSKFTIKPEEHFVGKQVMVSGVIIDYKGKPEIIINDPKQIAETDITDPKLYVKNQ